MNKAVLQFAGFALGALGLLLTPALVAAEGKTRVTKSEGKTLVSKSKTRVTVNYPAKSAGRTARPQVAIRTYRHAEPVIGESPNLKLV